ncbi:MAG TPA: hypothetical protein VGO61_07005 [Steroidobacteraceae bacterium]|jgi:hypothetical protein|nr:hypothetical protein [Steroidobacteraceae bacterium]
MKNNQLKSGRGGKRTGAGRPKGSPNKVTMDVRKAFAHLLEAAAPKLETWLTRVAKRSPARALDIVAKLAEYHVPKLGKLDHNIEGEKLVRLVNLTGVRIGSGSRESVTDGPPITPPSLK